MVRFWVCLVEVGMIRIKQSYDYQHIRAFLGEVWGLLGGSLRGYGRWWREFWGDIWAWFVTRFGRPKKASHSFTWWTYYVAVTQSLRHARMAKNSWGETIDAATCCEFYYRYEGVQKRAREKGYVKLASGDIHKWNVTSRRLVKVKDKPKNEVYYQHGDN
jgi:hypothetical protein